VKLEELDAGAELMSLCVEKTALSSDVSPSILLMEVCSSRNFTPIGNLCLKYQDSTVWPIFTHKLHALLLPLLYW